MVNLYRFISEVSALQNALFPKPVMKYLLDVYWTMAYENVFVFCYFLLLLVLLYIQHTYIIAWLSWS